MEQNNEKNTEISFGFLLKIFKANIVLILIVAIVCAGAAGAFRYFTAVPTYTSSVTFFANGLAMNSASGQVVVNPGNASNGVTLAKSFAEALSKSNNGTIIRDVIDILPEGEKYDLSIEAVQGCISVEQGEETQLIKVSVTHPDSEVAYEIAHAIEKVAPKFFANYVTNELMEEEDSTFQFSKVDTNKYPDLPSNAYFVSALDRTGSEIVIPGITPSKGVVVAIDNLGFYGCEDMEKITIPNSILMIGGKAFKNCNQLKTIKFEGTVSEWNSIKFGADWSNGKELTVACTDGEVKIAAAVSNPENVSSEKAPTLVLLANQNGGTKDDPFNLEVIKVIDNARPDTTPSSKGVTTYALIAGIIGALVVYIIAFFRAFLDNTIYTDMDIKARYELPIIGQIPTWDNENSLAVKNKKASKKLALARDYSGRTLNKNTPFAVSEAFKLLRTNMCYTTKGEKCAVYGVTSDHAGAGKSLIISNLALSFAEMDKKVLLIDADLRSPVQNKIFHLNRNEGGLSEYLAGVTENIASISHSVAGAEHLTVITSGRIPPNPAELLASPNMAKLIEKAKEEYDVVLIDLPPICEVTDAGVITDLVTGYAIVVRAAHSNYNMVSVAMDMMTSVGASVIGFVLNDVDIKSGDYYKNKYGYKYGYKYGARRYRDAYSYEKDIMEKNTQA